MREARLDRVIADIARDRLIGSKTLPLMNTDDTEQKQMIGGTGHSPDRASSTARTSARVLFRHS